MKDSGSTCKFRNARSAFSKFTRGSAVFHNAMRNKQVEFNPYIYTLSKFPVLAMKYPFFNTQQGSIPNSRQNCRLIRHGPLSRKYGCQNFSYVHSSRKHWKCKYSAFESVTLCKTTKAWLKYFEH